MEMARFFPLTEQMYAQWVSCSIAESEVHRIIGHHSPAILVSELMSEWMREGFLAPFNPQGWTQLAQLFGIEDASVSMIAERLSVSLRTELLSLIMEMRNPDKPEVSLKDPVEDTLSSDDLSVYTRFRDAVLVVYNRNPELPPPTWPGTAAEAPALSKYIKAAKSWPNYITYLGEPEEKDNLSLDKLPRAAAYMAQQRARYQLCGLWDEEEREILHLEEARIDALTYMTYVCEDPDEEYAMMLECMIDGLSAVRQPEHARNARNLLSADLELVQAYFKNMHSSAYERSELTESESTC
jgi:hypothetical protein